MIFLIWYNIVQDGVRVLVEKIDTLQEAKDRLWKIGDEIADRGYISRFSDDREILTVQSVEGEIVTTIRIKCIDSRDGGLNNGTYTTKLLQKG